MKRILLINILLSFLAWQIGMGQILHTISYQGVLTETTGTMVTDG